MRAMVLDAPGRPLFEADLPDPEPGPGEVLVAVSACGVCRTDLHIVDGELADAKLPLVLGHQVVGHVVAGGERFQEGARVGIPWLGWACGECTYCRSGRENLCDRARFTGYHRDGGYAELALADERFCVPMPENYTDLEAAPLLCAGLIGYRALRLAGEGARLGLYGFGASAHIVAQVARYQGRRVFAFTRAGDERAQSLALELGAEWASDATRPAPEELDAAIIFAPAGELVPAALRASRQGRHGRVRGHSHVDIPALSLRAALGRARRALGGQPDPARRRGVHGARSPRTGADGGRELPARGRECRARAAAGRRRARSGGVVVGDTTSARSL